MFKQILAVVCFAALLQNIKTESLDDIYRELIPQLDALKESISKTIAQKKVDLDNTHSSIGQKLSQANANIGVQLEALSTQLKAAKQQAETSGKNIEACIKDEKLAINNLDRETLNLCKKNEELNSVGIKLSELGSLDETVNDGPLNCLEQVGENAEKEKACLKSLVSQVENKKKTIANSIDDIIGNAKSDTDSCIKNEEGKILNDIKGISNDFNKCVQ